MIHPKRIGLAGLLVVGLLPIFLSTEADTNRRFLSLQTPISRTKTADDPQPGKSKFPAHLQWVRGSVLSWTSDSLTLQLEKGSLTLDIGGPMQIVHAVAGTPKVISADQLKDEVTGRDKEAKPDSLAVGSLAQVHYFKRDHKSYAILIVEETGPVPQPVKKSGNSFLGVLVKAEFGTIHLRSNGRTRRLYPSRGTPFVDSTGYRARLRELKPGELKAGDMLVVTYRMEPALGLDPLTTVLAIHRITLR
jgi:hypothetical protein